MSRDEDETEESTFEEIMEAIEEERSERREQVSYEWVKTVREVGELYRNSESVEAVSEELDKSEETVQEALTVYRLLFEDPPKEVASKASIASRRFFSVERDDSESFVDENEDEPIEELVREYIGAAYLEHDIDIEPVGEPPERSTPPSAVSLADLAEELGEDFPPTIDSLFESTAISNIQDVIRPYQGNTIGPILANYPQNTVADAIRDYETTTIGNFVGANMKFQFKDMAEDLANQRQQTISNIVASGFVGSDDVFQSITSNLIPSFIGTIPTQQNLLAENIADGLVETQIPEPLIRDFETLEPAFSAAAATSSVSTPTGTDVSETAEQTTVETETSEVGSVEISNAPTDSTTPDVTPTNSGHITTELVFEIPFNVTRAILSDREVRGWYNNLPRGYQLSIANVLLVSIAFALTQNLAMSSLSTALAPGIRQMLLEKGIENEE